VTEALKVPPFASAFKADLSPLATMRIASLLPAVPEFKTPDVPMVLFCNVAPWRRRGD
jgi:hypothetical protein